MDKVNKFQPVFIGLSMILGLILGFNPLISKFCSNLEEPLLTVLLFFIFFEIDFGDLKKEIKNIKFISTEYLMNFIWTPLLAYSLALVFISQDHIQLALILLLVMPCTDWYLIFTNITGGNVPLSSAILPINLISQLVLLPLYLSLFFGINKNIDVNIAFEVIVEILIPILLALITKFIISKFKSLSKLDKILDTISDKAEIILVCLIALVIFASNQADFITLLKNFPSFMIALVLFYLINFTLSFNLGRLLGFNNKDRISLVFTTTARNTPLSLTLAAFLFPNQPIISIALLIGAITELPASAIESYILKKLLNKPNFEKST